MNDRIHRSGCPVCGGSNLKPALQVKDHSVSGEMFTIVECGNCTLRFTQDIPGENSIGPYYKTEDYISHTNTSKGLINRIYLFVRRSTMKRKRRLVQAVTGLHNGSLLDLGSGVGSFVHEMQSHGWEVTGLEPDTDARKVGEQLYNLSLKDSSTFYQLPAHSFDAITMWHVLEHVHELEKYVLQLKNILKPSGKLLIAVPNYTAYDGESYGPYWAAYDVPRHLYHFSPRAMKMLVEKFGLNVESHRPMWYDSFYISLLSSKYKNGSTNWFGAVWTGLWSNLRALGNMSKCSSVIYVVKKQE